MHKKMKLSENIAVFENGLAEVACSVGISQEKKL